MILQHYDEARNAIATARMAHLSMTNSRLIVGNHFGDDAAVNALIADTSQRNVVLYPKKNALPIEQVFADEAAGDSRPLVFWVLDAKWSKVPKMLRLSPNVCSLPMVAFSPQCQSRFQIRRQPHPACLSTIEAIHAVIDRYVSVRQVVGVDHQALLDVFQFFVDQQLAFVSADDKRHAAAKQKRSARQLRNTSLAGS